MMPQQTHDELSVAVGPIEMSILNDTPETAEVFRIHPTSFEEQRLVDLAPGETKKVMVAESDCLIAKVGDRVISYLGVCSGLSEWRLDANDSHSRSSCPFVVSNNAEKQSIFFAPAPMMRL